METEAQKNKRIAKNTILLYLRMFLMMLIGLYTSRVVLNTLGFDDYGINNVVGGIVVLFSVFTGTLSTAIGRFITFELGTGNKDKLKTVFSTSILVQCAMAVIIMMLCEVLGYWLLIHKMSIPDGRMDAALWVFHCSVISFGLCLLFVPFSSLVIAHEKMEAFAYVSILEAVAKLLIVYLLLVFSVDKLKLYAVLLLSVSVLINSIYIIYCRRHFEESKLVWRFDKSIFKHIASFAGWNLFGHGAWMLETQGVNILINMFFGVQLNAARGIAVQVNNIVQQFVNNFMTALSPQITKSYASGDLDYMNSIVLKGAKFSYLLLFMVALPVALETDTILKLWLKDYPDYTVPFVRLTLAISLCMVLVNPFLTALRATGNIRSYQIVVGFVGLLQFPIVFVAFRIGLSPTSSYFISLAFYLFFVIFKPWLIRNSIHLTIRDFLSETIVPSFLVSLFSMLVPLAIMLSFKNSISRLVCVCLACFVATSLCVWLLGLTKGEKIMAKSFVLSKLTHNRRS